jgi:hypothetical protein
VNKFLTAALALALMLSVPAVLGPLQFPVMFALLAFATYQLQPLWDDAVFGFYDLIIKLYEHIGKMEPRS